MTVERAREKNPFHRKISGSGREALCLLLMRGEMKMEQKVVEG